MNFITNATGIFGVCDSMEPNPHQCQQTNNPQRDFNCEYYDHCLNQAARGRWNGFTCVACQVSKSPVNHSSVVARDQALEIDQSVFQREGLKKGGRNPMVF
jgi:hypothetical protein